MQDNIYGVILILASRRRNNIGLPVEGSNVEEFDG